MAKKPAASSAAKPAKKKRVVPPGSRKGMGGRPSKYKKEFCKKLVDHMKKGFSFESFGAVRGVNTTMQTLYEWAKDERKPEFAEAKREGELHARKFWENLLIRQAAGHINGSNSALIFALKNKFPKEWRDKQEVEHSGDVSISIGYEEVPDREDSDG